MQLEAAGYIIGKMAFGTFSNVLSLRLGLGEKFYLHHCCSSDNRSYGSMCSPNRRVTCGCSNVGQMSGGICPGRNVRLLTGNAGREIERHETSPDCRIAVRRLLCF